MDEYIKGLEQYNILLNDYNRLVRTDKPYNYISMTDLLRRIYIFKKTLNFREKKIIKKKKVPYEFKYNRIIKL